MARIKIYVKEETLEVLKSIKDDLGGSNDDILQYLIKKEKQLQALENTMKIIHLQSKL